MGERAVKFFLARVKGKCRRNRRERVFDHAARKFYDFVFIGEQTVRAENFLGALIAYEQTDIFQNVERRVMYARDFGFIQKLCKHHCLCFSQLNKEWRAGQDIIFKLAERRVTHDQAHKRIEPVLAFEKKINGGAIDHGNVKTDFVRAGDV